MSGENIVDPDAAVTQLEAVAALLQELSAQERAIVIEEVIALGKENPDPKAREFIVGLPGNLGLL